MRVVLDSDISSLMLFPKILFSYEKMSFREISCLHETHGFGILSDGSGIFRSSEVSGGGAAIAPAHHVSIHNTVCLNPTLFGWGSISFPRSSDV